MSRAAAPRHRPLGLVEDAAVVSIAALQRAGRVTDGHVGKVGRMSRTGPLDGSVQIRVRLDGLHGRLELSDAAGPRPAHQAAADRFLLVATRPTFGGTRWWAMCPCGRRVAFLYRRPGSPSFCCRVCAGLAYRSQREAEGTRLARRADALRARLGEGGLWPIRCASGSLRPFGMRRRTYHRLRAAIDRIDDALVWCAARAIVRGRKR